MWKGTFILTMLSISLGAPMINSSLMLWAIIEVMLVVVVALMVSMGDKVSIESALKYFIIQCAASLVILLVLLEPFSLDWLLIMMLILKMGLVPFHGWVPVVYSGLPWDMVWVVSVIQKIPILHLSQSVVSGYVMCISALLSVGLGSLMGVMSTMMKKMMGYSSIVHSGWLYLLLSASGPWESYLFVYGAILWGLFYILSKDTVKSFWVTDLLLNSESAVIIYLLLCSTAGFPPLLGFSLKWITTTYIISVNSVLGLLVVWLVAISVYWYFMWGVSNIVNLKLSKVHIVMMEYIVLVTLIGCLPLMESL